MNVYTNNTLTGHYPVGTSAIVVDDSPGMAAHQLEMKLKEMGLIQSIDPDSMKLVDTTESSVTILQDGDY